MADHLLSLTRLGVLPHKAFEPFLAREHDVNRLAVISLFVAGAIFGFGGQVAAGPIVTPVYSRTYTDCTTFQNQQPNNEGKQRWTISAGCDSYQNEFYERPTTQTYEVNQTGGGEIFAAKEYFQNLDIVRAMAGVDTTYLYTAIDLAGLNHLTEAGGAGDLEGLKYQYEFLLSPNADGASGYWLALKEGTPIGTSYQLLRNEGQRDTNGDVGGSGAANGLSITKQDNAPAALGNGFDTDVIDDGKWKSTGAEVLFSRLRPGDLSVVEFAVDYGALGFTQAQIQAIIAGTQGYLDFRAIKGGPKDPQNYLWNDEYTKSEAGSPYRCGDTAEGCSDLTKSEFGTQGLGNIYELDTLRGAGLPPPPQSVPEPHLLVLFGLGLMIAAARFRKAKAS